MASTASMEWDQAIHLFLSVLYPQRLPDSWVALVGPISSLQSPVTHSPAVSTPPSCLTSAWDLFLLLARCKPAEIILTSQTT